MLRQRGAALLAETSQDIEHARRQELLTHLGHQQHAERCVLRRLQHQRIPGTQRGRDLQRTEQHRRVPRNDRTHDPERSRLV
jgi:hypothetical protein